MLKKEIKLCKSTLTRHTFSTYLNNRSLKKKFPELNNFSEIFTVFDEDAWSQILFNQNILHMHML